MSWISEFSRRMRRLVSDASGELNEELRYHVEQAAQANLAAGMSAEDARRQALIEFGAVERIKEECREQRSAALLQGIIADLRYAARGLRRSPSFAVAAIVTFAVGIGATTAVFSVVDRILFRSLPYRDAGRLVSLGVTAPIEPQEFMLGYSYYEWQDHQTPFETVTSWTGINNCDLTEQNALRLTCARVEANFLPALGIGPLLGRNFTADEDRPNAPKVALLSYQLWQGRFGGDPSLVGRTIPIDGNPVRVIGVLNRDFELPTLDPADVLMPEGIDPAQQRTANPGRVRWAFARLKSGVGIEQAKAAMEPLFKQMLQTVPPQFRKEVHLKIRSLRDRQLHDAKLAAWILLGAVVLVLMIACANVSSLLLARSAGRQREIAVRSALGATRARLIRQTLTESLMLSLPGTVVGYLLAALLVRAAISVAPAGVPLLEKSHLDLRIAVFAVMASAICSVFFGIVPALSIPKAELLAGRSSTGVKHRKTRGTLVIAQVAVSVVLLAGASLLLRSLWKLQAQPLGMNTERLVTATLSLGEQRYPTSQNEMTFFQELETRLRKLPGVTAVAISDSLPPGGWHHDHIYAGVRVEGKPLPAEGTGGTVAWRWVTPDYFRVLRVPILRGRSFREEDRNSSDHFIIVSQALANRMFPNEEAVGRHLQPGLEGPWYTIVGVAADVKNGGLTGRDEPEYYRLRRNHAEDWSQDASVTLETALGTQTTETWMRNEIAALDPTLPVVLETMNERVSKLADRPRFEAALLGLFAIVGVLLAGMGIYGVISSLVEQRIPEIGVRLAMGAKRADILRLVGLEGVRMMTAGMFFGVLIASAGTRVLNSLLFGVRRTDPGSFFAVLVLLSLIGGLATWIPAQRATKVEPMEALRYE
jgi:putative ABC transport system permease protein